MKLTLAFTLFFTLNLYANGYGQQKINIKAKKTDIADVLSTIEKQTQFRFLYNSDLAEIKTPITINAREATVENVLSIMLFGTSLSYQMMDNNLIVIKADPLAKQDVVVKGSVMDENGAPMPGVSVMVKGSTIGTTTNAEGNFTLSVPDANVTLVFTSVGYTSKEQALNGSTDVNIVLSASKQVMDQVVVIGYGTANKRDLTGSIVKIEGKEVADKPNTNPIASLQGKVAGLSVVNNGTPGGAPDIRIRGTVSIGNVHPLYVVDGIFNDNIDYINPSDIESIEILKDPSSLAIFGVRGATGVIAITTKKAKSGQTIVNFNTSVGVKKLVDKIKMANAQEFATLFAEERANDASNPTTVPYDYTGLNANTDWIDAVTRTGRFNNNNLSISNSTERNKVNFGLGYVYDEGIIRHEQLSKWMASLNDELKIGKNVKIGANINVSRQRNPYGAGWVLDAARKVIPQVSAGTKTFNVVNPYGTDTLSVPLYSRLDEGLQNSGVINPLLVLENEWDKTLSYELRTVGSVFAEVSFLKNFTFRSTLYGDISNVNTRIYTPLYYGYDPKTDKPVLWSTKTGVSENDQTWRKFQQDHLLNYKTRVGASNIAATTGFTTYYFGNFNRSATAPQGSSVSSLPIPNDPRFWYINSGFQDQTNTSSSSGQSEYATVSFLARVLYNYNNKYFLNASFRNDASSRIPPKNRNQQFWAVGAAWELTKEDFMASQNIFDFVKLKASVGVLGNQTASQLDGTPINYPFYPNLLTGTNAVFGTNVYTAAREAYLKNPDLKWESVLAKEIGVELNAINNKLHFEANYFNRLTRDLMTYVSRGTIGLQDKLINGGKIRNTGQEFTASWSDNLASGWNYSIGGNITFMQNKVVELSKELPNGFLSRAFMNNGSAESRTMVGYPIASFYGYVVEGIYQSYADILNSPPAGGVGGYRPGDFKFKDIDGDGVITPSDRTVIGNPTPDFSYGMSGSVGYQGLSLSVDVGGVYGNEVFRTWGSLESPFQRVNYSGEKVDRWNGAGSSNWVPILGQGDRFNYNGSTYNIEDGSYFRIRNLQLAYSFNPQLLSRIGTKNLRIFVNAQNLKTFKHNLGYTAEFGGDATAFGYDYAGGAIPAVYSAGLNVTF